VADKVAILRQGRIVAFDAPAVLRSQAQAGTLVRVELAAPCHAALDMLQTLPGVDEPSVPDGQGAVENGAKLDYCTADPQLVNPIVVAHLVGLGAQVVSVTCHAPSLEDVYASAVTGDGALRQGALSEGAPSERVPSERVPSERVPSGHASAQGDHNG
jgi:ABC-type multidrug transport system ATPase subunit